MNRQELMNLKPEKKICHFTFSLKAILGKGSFGTVYLGRDSDDQKIVAMKVIDHSKIGNAAHQFLNLRKEIDIMKKLKHPNIVQLHEVYSTANNTYLIQEYCNGPDLKQYLSEKRILPEQEAIKMIKQIANGLKEIVSNNFIHRDLKPANILIHNDQCKIADFGFSRPLPEESVMESLVGTPLYMAPQILQKQQYTSKCDIWSLGLIFYEMLFGTLPWMATNYMELVYKLVHTKLVFPKNIKISSESESFIIGCLQKDEIRRFSWNEVFHHPLLKPPMSIQLDQGTKEIYSPKFATHRAPQNEKSSLPTLRERSCSGKTLQFKQIDNKVDQKQEPPSTSQQSTECEDNVKQYFFAQHNERQQRRTKSHLDGNKTNQTDISNAKKLNIQPPNPTNPNIIKQNFTIKNCPNIDQLFKKTNLKITKNITTNPSSNHITNPTTNPITNPTIKSIITDLFIQIKDSKDGDQELLKFINFENENLNKPMNKVQERINQAMQLQAKYFCHKKICHLLDLFIRLLTNKNQFPEENLLTYRDKFQKHISPDVK